MYCSLCCLLLLFICCDGKLTILSDGSFHSFDIVLGGFPREEPSFSPMRGLSAKMSDPIDGCSLVSPSSASVLFMDGGKCYPSTKAINAQKAGAVGIVVFGYKDDLGTMKYLNGFDGALVSVFAFEVGRENREVIQTLLSASNVTVDIVPDSNPFDPPVQSSVWILYTLCVGSANLFLIIFATYRIARFRRFKKMSFLPISTYSLLGISALMRLIIVLDPSGGRFLLPSPIRTVLFGLPLSFNIIASITVALYWIHVFSSKNISNTLDPLKQYRWPYGIVIILVFVLTVLYVCLSAALIESLVLVIASGIVNTIVNAAIFVFFCYACHLIHVSLRRGVIFKETTFLLKRLLFLGVVQSACLMAYFVLGAIFATPLANQPVPFALLPSLLNLFVTILSLSQSMMFGDPQTSDQSYSRSSYTGPVQLPVADISIL